MEEEPIVCEEKIPSIEIEPEGMMYAGRNGGVDSVSLLKTRNREKRIKETYDYRECIPCEKCNGFIEIRGFNQRGKEKVLGCICRILDCDVEANHTCNNGRLPRRPYRRVIYVMENAPKGFREGLTSGQIRKLDKEPETEEGAIEGFKVEATIPREGYKGGSGYYRRKDGDKEAEGTGKIPRKLID